MFVLYLANCGPTPLASSSFFLSKLTRPLSYRLRVVKDRFASHYWLVPVAEEKEVANMFGSIVGVGLAGIVKLPFL